MNEINSRAMELMCLQRAKDDPEHSGKWLAQAERWRDLAKRETAWRFQRRGPHSQMHAGPMVMGPASGDTHTKQQG